MKDDNKNYKEQSLIKSVLTSEVKFVIGVITIALGVVAPYYSIKQDIALIKENHFTHMENFDKELVRQSEIQTKQQDTLIKLMQEIAKLER